MRTFSHNFRLHETVLIVSLYILFVNSDQSLVNERATNIVYRVYRVLTNIDYYGIGGSLRAIDDIYLRLKLVDNYANSLTLMINILTT